jgi:hypothetical protein
MAPVVPDGDGEKAPPPPPLDLCMEDAPAGFSMGEVHECLRDDTEDDDVGWNDGVDGWRWTASKSPSDVQACERVEECPGELGLGDRGVELERRANTLGKSCSSQAWSGSDCTAATSR